MAAQRQQPAASAAHTPVGRMPPVRLQAAGRPCACRHPLSSRNARRSLALAVPICWPCTGPVPALAKREDDNAATTSSVSLASSSSPLLPAAASVVRISKWKERWLR